MLLRNKLFAAQVTFIHVISIVMTRMDPPKWGFWFHLRLLKSIMSYSTPMKQKLGEKLEF